MSCGVGKYELLWNYMTSNWNDEWDGMWYDETKDEIYIITWYGLMMEKMIDDIIDEVVTVFSATLNTLHTSNNVLVLTGISKILIFFVFIINY